MDLDFDLASFVEWLAARKTATTAAPLVAELLAVVAALERAPGTDKHGGNDRALRVAELIAQIRTWWRRYREEGLAGLQSRPMSGRPKRLTAAQEHEVVARTMRPPQASTHWSATRLAEELALVVLP